jgi:hypothetical protein
MRGGSFNGKFFGADGCFVHDDGIDSVEFRASKRNWNRFKGSVVKVISYIKKVQVTCSRLWHMTSPHYLLE